MDLIGKLWTYGPPTLIVLSVLVFVHELGHYWIARRNGVRIVTFSIGFGPELFGRTDRAGTRWKFSLIPLGGYVRMFGDADAASRPGDTSGLTAAERAVAFQHKRLGQRAAIVAAGPIANFLFAMVLMAGLFMVGGSPIPPAIVGTVAAGTPGEAGGFQPGDRVVAIGDRSVDRFADMARLIQTSEGRPLDVTVRRDGETIHLAVAPEHVPVTDQAGEPVLDAAGNPAFTWRIGIGADGGPFDVLTSLKLGVTETWDLSRLMLRSLWEILVGDRGTEELGGPIQVVYLSGEVAQAGIVPLGWFMAILSINLGLINLLPVPMLDGGHLLFYALEAVRGRPLGERAQEYGFRIGLALVLTLMVFVTWNDLVQLRVLAFLQGLIS